MSAGVRMPLSQLQRLEAKSLHIFREAVADAHRPVLLYSMGIMSNNRFDRLSDRQRITSAGLPASQLPGNSLRGFPRSIDPRSRKLMPRRCAISSWVRPDSFRIHRRLADRTSLRSIRHRSQRRHDRSRNDGAIVTARVCHEVAELSMCPGEGQWAASDCQLQLGAM